MLKLSENPAILTPPARSLTQFGGTWWVARTRARFEKAFAWDMLSHGINYFLPMREKTFYSGGRRRRAMIPIFTSYVFVCGTEVDRYMALMTNRLCQMIDVSDQEGFTQELLNLEKALMSGAAVEYYPRFPVGSRGRIVNGPMRGIEGTVVERTGVKAHLVLEVTILGQRAIVEVDTDLLAPAEAEERPAAR